MEDININNVSMAEYNPRSIKDDRIEDLAQSIMNVGFVIPVIYNTYNSVLLAGHQRLKASKRIGLTEVPAIGIEIKNKNKEINFNIVHNTLDNSKHSATHRKALKEIIEEHGNIFYAVKNESGDVLYGLDYLETEGIDHNIVIVEDRYSDYFTTDYGKYDYSSFTGYDYSQTKAQLNRAESMRSQLYTRFVEPYMNYHKDHVVLDFGSGKGFEANRMNENGFNFDEIEFYHKQGESITEKMIQKVVSREDLYDGVVVDSVLNSVTQEKYQKYIIQLSNAFMKTGGHLFISSRSAEYFHRRLSNNQVDNGSGKNKVYSMDDKNFTVSYRGGLPFFQKFDYKQDIIDLAIENGFRLVNEFEHTSFYLEFEKINDCEYEQAIIEEFSLPKASGGNYNFSESVLNFIKNKKN